MLKNVIVIKIIVLVLVSSFLGCSNLKVVTYSDPMINNELVYYIRMIEQRRLLSLQNYFYKYGFHPDYYRNYNYNPYFNNSYNNYRSSTQRITPTQTGTTGSTINVQPSIPKGNIKTKQ